MQLTKPINKNTGNGRGANLVGRKMPGSGRAKGVVNKVVATAREAIASFVDGNAPRLEGFLDRIANGIPAKNERTGEVILNNDGSIKWVVEPNPKAAFDAMQSVVEYHIPKLARQEVTGANGGPIAHASLVANLDLKNLSDAELEQVQNLLGRAK